MDLLECSVCQQPTKMKCECGLAYYCDFDHQLEDWRTHHSFTCTAFIPHHGDQSVIDSSNESIMVGLLINSM